MAVTRLATNGTNGDALPSTWVTSFVGGDGVIDVQSNKFRIATANVGGYSGIARAEYRLSLPYGADIQLRVTPGQAWSIEAYFVVGMGDTFATSGDTSMPGYGWGYTLEGGGNVSKIWSVIDGARTDPPLANTSRTFNSSNPVRFRIQRVGNLVRSKVWDDGGNEPEAWLHTATDTAPPTTAPRTGSWHLTFGALVGSNVSVRRFDIDEIVINDLAPTRRPNGRRQ